MPTAAEKRRTFRALHREGCFVIPNPWDVGSARYLQSLGFKALATTSAGAAWTLGYADGALPLEPMLEHIRAIAEASDLPVNADFANAFADSPEGVAANVARCAATGVAGLSVEDQIPGTRELYEFELAVERVRAARAALDAEGGDTLLVARTECFVVGHPDARAETIRRLVAFSEAGADCLYAPHIRTRELIAAVVAAVAPKPVNVLAIGLGGLTVADLAGLGVRRISVGGAMSRMAWAGLQRIATEIAERGSFDAFADATPGTALDALFTADIKRRGK
jgi:2-methylisocitrate lyase-like PEP mutase family enzyme